MPHGSPAQRSERIRQIIDGAFETWGRSVFFHTRLDDLADRLRMTKPALYRYFASKQALLAAMEKDVLAAYEGLGRRFAEEAAGLAPAAAVDRFVAGRIAFFGAHVERFYFMVHQAATHGDGAVIRALDAQGRLLARRLAEVPGIHDAATAAGYIRATVTFFLIRAGLRDEALRPRRLSQVERDDLSSLVQGICARGYAGPRPAARPPMEALERSCAVGLEELQAEDPILRAVAETVAEHGFAEASMERIARRAGLTKSSLYFHFRDRNAMFAGLLERHQRRVQEIFEDRARSCRGSGERLYCFLVVLWSYFRAAREVPAVMNWFRYHGFRLGAGRTDAAAAARRFAFLQDAVSDGTLTSQGLSLLHMAGHLGFVVANHMIGSQRTARGARAADLRQIYDLFVHGIQGAQA